MAINSYKSEFKAGNIKLWKCSQSGTIGKHILSISSCAQTAVILFNLISAKKYFDFILKLLHSLPRTVIPCVTRSHLLPSGLQIHVNLTSFMNEGAQDAIKRNVHNLPFCISATSAMGN